MEWVTEFLPQLGVVETVTSGALVHDDLERMIAETAEMARQHGTRLSLIDHRQSTSTLSIVDIYRLAAFQISNGLAFDNRVAIVVPTPQLAAAEARFFDDRTVNTGMARRLFDDRDRALRWLTEG